MPPRQTYLKEILNDICTYRVSAPNRNTWELKPEYRCYKKEPEEKGEGEGEEDGQAEDVEDDDDFEE